ncbi:MAG: four helix bundle protein [Ignavibacteria bacterium]
MKILKFEDIKIWQDARELVKQIYMSPSNQKFSKDFGLRDQIQRAAISIMSNIAEGYERDSNRELIRFLHFSKGSAGEVRSLLYVAHDLEYLNKEEFRTHYEFAVSIIKQIANFIKYLKQRNKA